MGVMRKQVDNLAVFDLDDTIYDGNSHFALLNYYYHTKIFTSFVMRAFGKIFPSLYMKLCYWAYNKIPQSDRYGFVLPYRQEVIKLMHEKLNAGYALVIVSNAPADLLQTAGDMLNVLAIRAEFGGKAEVVAERFCYKRIFVCTDNKTDIDLLKIADEAVITCKKEDRRYFEKRLNGKKYQFIDEGAER